jgi:hypothetical protein
MQWYDELCNGLLYASMMSDTVDVIQSALAHCCFVCVLVLLLPLCDCSLLHTVLALRSIVSTQHGNIWSTRTIQGYSSQTLPVGRFTLELAALCIDEVVKKCRCTYVHAMRGLCTLTLLRIETCVAASHTCYSCKYVIYCCHAADMNRSSYDVPV